MTVINSLEGFCDCFRDESRCGACGDELAVPFLAYCCGGDGLFLCGKCAYHIKDGLTADLIQLAAAVELQQLYPTRTFVRRDLAQVDAEQRERWKKFRPQPPGVVDLFPPTSDDEGRF